MPPETRAIPLRYVLLIICVPAPTAFSQTTFPPGKSGLCHIIIPLQFLSEELLRCKTAMYYCQLNLLNYYETCKRFFHCILYIHCTWISWQYKALSCLFFTNSHCIRPERLCKFQRHDYFHLNIRLFQLYQKLLYLT